MTSLYRALLGSAAALTTASIAQAADLPTRKAAPVEYVRVCDAYGAGFFYIPGTDTCLRVGGLVQAQMRIQPSSVNYRVNAPIGSAVGTFPAFPGIAGALPAATGYVPVNGREIFGYDVGARIELDSRTQSPYGTVRTFLRLNAQYGSSANSTTGSLSTSLGFNAFNTTAGPTVSKELVFLDKAFIQFAGITAGRAQSLFDFYADAVNFESLRGSNSTVWTAAYTGILGGGFTATIAIEDSASRRGDVSSVLSAVPGIIGIGPAGLAATTGVTAFTAAARMPDIVGVLRVDQPWGAAQLSAAAHQVRANLFPAVAATAGAGGNPTAYAQSSNNSSSLGFAVQGGVQFNLDGFLSKGDKFWIQATYAKGAIGYVSGSNLSFNNGPSASTNYGIGANNVPDSWGWAGGYRQFDCVFTWTGSCDKSSAFAIVAALKHFWTPTLSSSLFGSYYRVVYGTAANTPVNLFTTIPAVGLPNYNESRVGTNLVWTPIKNFDIGGEFTWVRATIARPSGLAPDVVLNAFGLPSYKGTTDVFASKVRMQRAF